MIFANPSGAPELACDECGCRWFDRMRNGCYECGAEVSAAALQEFSEALEDWGQSKRAAEAASARGPAQGEQGRIFGRCGKPGSS